MSYLCRLLMGIIGIGMFFWMMIKGWGLEIRSLTPIILYYIWWFGSMIAQLAIAEYEKKKK